MITTLLQITYDPFFNVDILSLIDSVADPANPVFQQLVGSIASYAQGIAAVGILISFSVKAYKMMLGEGQLEFLSLLRPFALIIVIANFTLFASIVKYPFQMMNQAEVDQFNGNVAIMNQEYYTRMQAIDSLIDVAADNYSAVKEAADAAAEANTAGGSVSPASDSNTSDDWFGIVSAVEKAVYKADNRLQFAGMCLLEWVMMGILKFILYAVLVIASFFIAILISLGPLSFGMSVFNGFHQNYLSWISRFISACLYKGMAYLILNVCVIILQTAILHDQNRIDTLITSIQNIGATGSNPQAIFLIMDNLISSLDLIFAIVCLSSALALATVPVISTWIVTTTGISPAVAKMGRAASTAVSVASGVAKAVI